MSILVADIETDGFIRNVTTLWTLGIKDLETGKSVAYSDHSNKYRPVKEGIARLAKAKRVIFHNGLDYDVPVLQHLGYDVSHENVYDTLVAARLHNPSREGGHSLKVLGEWFVARKMLPKGKGEFKDFSQFSDEMVEYMLDDLEVTECAYNFYEPLIRDWGEAVQLEHDVAWIISCQQRNGFVFDLEHAQRLHAQLLGEQFAIKDRLQEVFPPIWAKKIEVTPKKDRRVRHSEWTVQRPITKRGVTAIVDVPVLTQFVEGAPYTHIYLQDFNPAARQQIATRLIRKYGWEPDEFTDSGQPKVDETALKGLNYEEAKAFVDFLVLNKKVGMLENWLGAEHQGRIYGQVNPCGAVTRRMTHFNPNVAQADSDPRMRKCFRARPGWKQVGCDAEGLELRMLGHYLAKHDEGRFAYAVVQGTKEDGTDAHTINQKLVGLFKRDAAKTFIYALIYGAGDWKLGHIIRLDAWEAGHQITTNEKTLGKKARKRILDGLGLKDLVDGVKKRAKKGFLKGLDGSRIRVRSEHAALNTLLQSGGAIVMKKALVLFHEEAVERWGLPDVQYGRRNSRPLWAYCANVHDEVQIECVPEIAEEIGKLFADCIRRAGEFYQLRCPLGGAYAVGDDWHDTH